jgi:uncharacterized protein (TIGR03086 family)
MSEHLQWFTKAIYGFDHVVRLVPKDAWERPSPCSGWTARSVIGHVIAIQRYMEASLDDRDPTMNPMADPHKHAGDNPAAAWAATRDAILNALDRPGILHKTVKTFNGQQVADEMIGFNIADTTVHAWDLARATGVDDKLDLDLVDRILTRLEAVPDEKLRSPMVFGPKVDVSRYASKQARLLAHTGRQAELPRSAVGR